MERVGDGIGAVEDVFGAAMEDLGRLSATQPQGDGRALAHRVLAYCERDGFGATDALIRHMSEALGAGGRAEIRSKTAAALKTAPRSSGAQDWRADAQRRHLAFRLALLADLENNADAFITAIRAGGMESTHALDVAGRLIAANRPAEALDWLDKPRRRVEDEGDDGADTDLRIAALDALGRKDEAQAVRWRHFERFLSAEHLRAYLKRLPDFEDFEAEQKALDVAAVHKQAARGLAFSSNGGRSTAPTAWCASGWLHSTAASTRSCGRPRKRWRRSSPKRPACSTVAWSRACSNAAHRSNTSTPRAICCPARVSRRTSRCRGRSRATQSLSRGCRRRMDGNTGSGG